MHSAEDRELWRRWILAFTLGELIGFGFIAAAGGVLANALSSGLEDEARALFLYAVAIAGGLLEGAVLAWFQWTVLRGLNLGVSRHAWIGYTALAAGAAWALGMLAPTLDDLFGLEPAQQIGIWVPASILILLSIGAAQALTLRSVVPRASRWLVANALGWLAGLPWTFVLPALLPNNAPGSAFIVAFVIAGILMGATAGAVTGRCLLQLTAARAA